MTKEELNRVSSLYEEARMLSRRDKDTSRDFDPMMDLAMGGYSEESAIEKMVLSSSDYENLQEYSRFVGGKSGIDWHLIEVADENPEETTVENTVEGTGYSVNVVWTDGKVSTEAVEYGPALYWWPKNIIFMDAFREYSDVTEATLYLNGRAIESFQNITKRTHSDVIEWNDSWD